MNILLTNFWLRRHWGTEVYIRDLAIALHRQGNHVEVYAPELGAVAKEVRAAGVHVTDQVKDILMEPDLIHAQHFIPTMEVISRFSDVPVIYFLHDRTHLLDFPPRYSGILKFMAVDYHCLDRLIVDNGIPGDKTGVLLNWVDTSRFKLRKQIAAKPTKALVFSNYAARDENFRAIQGACSKMGIQLDGLGAGFGNPISDPERILKNYDIVFAKAKAAMEALATGAAVILCDFKGLGSMVTLENFDHYRKYNFGARTLSRAIRTDLIIQELKNYKPEDNRRVSEKIRMEAAFDRYLENITDLYHRTLADAGLHSSRNLVDDRKLIDDYLYLKEILSHNKNLKRKNAGFLLRIYRKLRRMAEQK